MGVECLAPSCLPEILLMCHVALQLKTDTVDRWVRSLVRLFELLPQHPIIARQLEAAGAVKPMSGTAAPEGPAAAPVALSPPPPSPLVGCPRPVFLESSARG